MKRWILANVAFIAGSLVAPGSIITEEDLGKVETKDEETGKTKLVPVKPPHDAIEIDAKGNPKDSDRAGDLSELLGTLAIHVGGASAPAQTPGGVSLAANEMTPAITAGHANPNDVARGGGSHDPVHGMDPTVGNLSPDVIEALTSNPEFMRKMAEALGAQKPEIVAEQDKNAASDGSKGDDKPAAGASAQSAAPTRRAAAPDIKAGAPSDEAKNKG